MNPRAPLSSTQAVLEADPSELERLRLDLDSDSDLSFYVDVLLAYWRGDTTHLASLVEAATASKRVASAPLRLAQLRLAIRLGDDVPLIPVPDDTLWAGEAHFVRALLHERHERHAEAKTEYESARRRFHFAGAHRKSAKAFHNAVACQSRIQPSRRFINEFREVARLAREVGDLNTAGAALNNLSREFQLMGAPRAALRMADEAIELLQAGAYGSYQFSIALCHRAHLHLELGHLNAAIGDVEEASASSLPAVQESLAVLRDWIAARGQQIAVVSPEAIGNAPAPATWRERRATPQSGPELSELEGRLVELLSDGSKDRVTLVMALWGDREDFFALENRFKQLVHRLRRKDANIVGFAEGKYYLIDDSKRSRGRVS